MALNFPDNPTLNQVYSAGGKTWSYNGSRWVLVIATAIIDVADGSITAAKIADGTIVATEIANSAITTAKIAAGAVTAAKLGNDISLTPADGSITQAKLAANVTGITLTTTANRSTDIPSPFTAQFIFLTDTNTLQRWSGSAWTNVIASPPGAPTSLSATALSTTSVSVTFTPGASAGASTTNYKYALSTDGGSAYGEPTAVDPADFTSPITISGLTGATTYHIKLKAVTDSGDSEFSSATSILVPSVPAAPTSLSGTALSTTSVSIAFTPGADNSSAITNYEYALSTDSGSTYGAFAALSPADATSPITISSLTDGTAYTIKLKAVNTYGAGAQSTGVSVATLATITTDYLVLAGGGGSNGAYYQGGAGAGGLRSSVSATGGGGSVESALSVVTGTSYAVIVGAGGVGGLGIGGVGANGVSSVFSTITSLGGSRAGGGTGGCGGAGAQGTAGQGYAGGTPADTSSYGTTGGGGGTGAVGGNGVGSECSTAGSGGSGVSNNITGSAVTYGGGGGGSIYGVRCGSGSRGSGGAGGGGAGASTFQGISAVSGTANLGGGGGGANHASTANGGSGGSGVVILRYPDTRTITIGAGLTGTTTSASGGYKRTTLTAGSGNVSWA